MAIPFHLLNLMFGGMSAQPYNHLIQRLALCIFSVGYFVVFCSNLGLSLALGRLASPVLGVTQRTCTRRRTAWRRRKGVTVSHRSAGTRYVEGRLFLPTIMGNSMLKECQPLGCLFFNMGLQAKVITRIISLYLYIDCYFVCNHYASFFFVFFNFFLPLCIVIIKDIVSKKK